MFKYYLKNKMISEIFYFFILFELIQSQYLYTPKQVINYLNEEKCNTNTLNQIIKYIIQTFEDTYTYLDFSKSPPQPSFNKNYHSEIDIIKMLNEININNISSYQFYQKLKIIIGDLKDLHTRIDLTGYSNKLSLLKNIFFFQPIDFYIQNINGIPKIFGKVNQYGEKFKKYYKNNENFEFIRKNKIPISKINNKSPFDFINDFGGNIESTKNTHGTFSYKFYYINGLSFFIYPLNLTDFEDFTIEFENGKIFSTDYILGSYSKIPDLISINKNELIDKRLNYKIRNFFKSNYISKNGNKLFDLNKYNLLTKHSIQKKNNTSEMKWDFEYENILRCRIDKINEINVFYFKNFLPNDLEKFKNMLNKCSKLFDNNSYPIIIIFNKNQGGYTYLIKYILEIISPLFTVNIYKGFKINNKNKKFFNKIINDQNPIFYSNIKKLSAFHYNNSFFTYIESCSIIKETSLIRNNLNNKRKPTDILLFTDGFSFSGADTLIKYLKYNGGAIIVGYFGNPIKNDIPFDCGQSSSSIFEEDLIYDLSPNGYKNLKDIYNIKFISITGKQTFYDILNISVPLEYEVVPVDERVNIYENFMDNSYDEFITEAKKIFHNYKLKCNKNNKKLILISEKCIFENEYTHGGYECGDDGFWSKKCIASYCDVGYVFDHNSKKCIEDKCWKIIDSEKINHKIIKTIFNFIILLIICLIAILFSYYQYHSKKSDKENSTKYIELKEDTHKNINL